MTIGIIDSGIGGLAALHKVVGVLGTNRYIYFSDNLFAPYGTLNKEKIIERTVYIAKYLAAIGADVIFVLCNTAGVTAGRIASGAVSIPVLYMLPDIVWAMRHSSGERHLLLATSATVRETKKRPGLAFCAAVNLATDIEKAAPNFETLRPTVARFTASFEGFDTVLLGCTHYIYLAPLFAEIYPTLTFTDGTERFRRQCISRLGKRPQARDVGSIEFIYSGKNEYDGYCLLIKELFKKHKVSLKLGVKP